MDWASMLNVLAFIYLTGGGKSFMFMYCTFIVVSILFDVVELAKIPAFSSMTPNEFFGSIVWIVIFALKPIIVGTMIAYDVLENRTKDASGAEGNTWTRFDDQGLPGYYDEDVDERVAA